MLGSVGSNVLVALAIALSATPVSGLAFVATATEPFDVDGMLSDLNMASAGSVATVIMACTEFHPDVIHVQSGQEILFLWDDPCPGGVHTVTSSGSTLDADDDLNKPVPVAAANCFDSSKEPIQNLLYEGNREYDLRLLYVGVVVRDVEDSLEFQEIPPYVPPDDTQPLCATDASFRFPDDLTQTSEWEAIVPYFCRLHARPEEAPAGEGMKGAIVLKM